MQETESIEALKGFVSECGLRKRWKLLLENLSAREAVSKLKEILENEAGVTGEPTKKKCQQAKQRLADKKDLEGIDVGNIVVTSARRARTSVNTFVAPPAATEPRAKKTQSKAEDEEDKDKNSGDSDSSSDNTEDDEEEDENEQQEDEGSESSASDFSGNASDED